MRPMPQLEVVEIPTDKLLEYPNNAKLHPSEQINQIANSIQEFGFNSPILAWHNDEGEPEIVAGHGRLMAAKKLGIDKLPVVFLDHMSEEQRRAYIIADNSTNLSSGFDMEILSVELDAIIDIDMEQFGIDLGISIDGFGEDFELPDGEAPEFKTVSLHMTAEQYELFEEMQKQVDASGEDGNMAARQVCEVIRQWQAQRM